MHPHDVKTADEVRQFLVANPDVRAVSTHLGRPPLPHPNCLPIVFLRHPLLRARSVFEFLRRDPSHPSPKESFPKFVQWALESRDDGGIVIRDYQVVHLSAASFCAPSILFAEATYADLDCACGLIDEWGVVGIVEEFDRSVAVFQHLYEPKIPSLNLQSTWLNRTTTETIRPMQEMLKEIHEILGPSLYAELVAVNELGIELYNFGRKVLARAEAKAFAGDGALIIFDQAASIGARI